MKDNASNVDGKRNIRAAQQNVHLTGGYGSPIRNYADRLTTSWAVHEIGEITASKWSL